MAEFGCSQENDEYEKLAVEVSTKLPILVDSEDFENNPGYAHLLTKLCEVVTLTGESKILNKKYKSKQEELRKAKREYFSHRIFLDELRDSLLDSQFTDFKDTPNKTNYKAQKFCREVEKCFSNEELQVELMKLIDNEELTPFGLTPDDVKPIILEEDKLQALIRIVLARIKARCYDLVKFYENLDSKTEADILHSKFGVFPHNLRADLEKQIENREEFLKKISLLYRQTASFKKTYFNYMDSLESFASLRIKNDRISKQRESVHARCDALLQKIRLMQLKIKLEICSSENIKATNVFRDHLEKELNLTETELAFVTEKLSKYSAVNSPIFSEILREYTDLEEQIEAQEWLLKEFKNKVDA